MLKVLLVLVVLAAILVAVQMFRPTPTAALHSAVPAAIRLPGTAPKLPWPTGGQATVEVQGIGSFGSVGGSKPMPMGSVAKIMTAYLILKDHPLGTAQQGPPITITPQDVATYNADLATTQSVAKVTAGEVLTERQALEALLIPSANNVATLLAGWDSGSLSAFVAKMNAQAKAMGLTSTHYADASGLDPATVSTPANQVKLAEAAMKVPAFRHIVAMPQVTLPVAGLVYNFNYQLGHSGIVGVKTGSTGQAGGCLVFAADTKVAGKPETVYGAVFGAGGVRPLIQAEIESAALVKAVDASLRSLTVVPSGTQAARIVAPWQTAVPVVSSSSASFIGWPGLEVTTELVRKPLGRTVPAGSAIASLKLALGTQQATVPLHTTGAVSSPPVTWRLARL